MHHNVSLLCLLAMFLSPLPPPLVTNYFPPGPFRDTNSPLLAAPTGLSSSRTTDNKLSSLSNVSSLHYGQLLFGLPTKVGTIRSSFKSAPINEIKNKKVNLMLGSVTALFSIRLFKPASSILKDIWASNCKASDNMTPRVNADNLAQLTFDLLVKHREGYILILMFAFFQGHLNVKMF